MMLSFFVMRCAAQSMKTVVSYCVTSTVRVIFFPACAQDGRFFMESLHSKLEPFRKQRSGMEGAIQFHDGKCRNLYFGGGA